MTVSKSSCSLGNLTKSKAHGPATQRARCSGGLLRLHGFTALPSSSSLPFSRSRLFFPPSAADGRRKEAGEGVGFIRWLGGGGSQGWEEGGAEKGREEGGKEGD